MQACRARKFGWVAAAAALWLAGCGGDDGSASGTTAQTTEAPASSATSGADTSVDAAASTEATSGLATTAASAETTASASDPATPNRCPLTAEQVSEVLGGTVDDIGACVFMPADAFLPSAEFVLQVPFACDDDMPAQVGYVEPYEGLGVRAYVQPGTALGTQLLVCTERPFEVSADLVSSDAAADLAAADALARLVLASL